MADIQDFHEGEERRKMIDQKIQEMAQMGGAKHRAQNAALIKPFLDKVLPALDKLHKAKASGETLSLEEEKLLVRMKHSAERMLDYLILSIAATDQRLLEASDKQYYHLKKLAKAGDKKAEEMYLELKKLRDHKIRKELGNRDN